MTKLKEIRRFTEMKASAKPRMLFSLRSLVILSLFTFSGVMVVPLVILMSSRPFIDYLTSGLEYRSRDLLLAGFLVFYFSEPDSWRNFFLPDGVDLGDL